MPRGRPLAKGHDPRRNLAGRPKLNADQRKALREMRSWTPAAIEALRLRLFGDPERDIKPEQNASAWLALWDRWAAYALGRPGDMGEQQEAAPETSEDLLEERWKDVPAAKRVRDLEEHLLPTLNKALEEARAELAAQTTEEPAALPAAEGIDR